MDDGKIGNGTEPTVAVEEFRRRLYGCLGRRADALFELVDAILTSGPAVSPVHLSLAAVHRRNWGSLYAALDKGSVEEEQIRELLATQQLADVPARARVHAVDRSSWLAPL